MNPQTELIELAAAMAEENCGIEKIYLYGLSGEEGMYVEPGQGYTETVYYDKSAVRILPLRFFRKGTDRELCMEELSAVCNYLEGLSIYPEAQSFTWLDAIVSAQPRRDETKEEELIYFCTIDCRVFY